MMNTELHNYNMQVSSCLQLVLGSEWISSIEGFMGVCMLTRDMIRGRHDEEAIMDVLASVLSKYLDDLSERRLLLDMDYKNEIYYGRDAYIRKVADMILQADGVEELASQMDMVDNMALNEYLPSLNKYVTTDEDVMMAFDLVSSALECFNSNLMHDMDIHTIILDCYMMKDKERYTVDIFDIEDKCTVNITLFMTSNEAEAVRSVVDAISKCIAYLLLTYEIEEEFYSLVREVMPGFSRTYNKELQANALGKLISAVAVKNSSNESIKTELIRKSDSSLITTDIEKYIINMCRNM